MTTREGSSTPSPLPHHALRKLHRHPNDKKHTSSTSRRNSDAILYYTDSFYMNPDEKYPLLDRMKIEGRFSRYLPGGAISRVPVAGNFSHKKSLIDFITAVFRETEHSQIYFTPDASANIFSFLK